jgi:uracil-DNA glycosylase family 4
VAGSRSGSTWPRGGQPPRLFRADGDRVGHRAMARGWTAVNRSVSTCSLCPRLVADREAAPLAPRGQGSYWARGVPGFGDPAAQILFIGLSPAPHGANRTGRPFTGDVSGSRLFAALYRCGLANQSISDRECDGLVLHNCFVTNLVKCSPADHDPRASERMNCQPFLMVELELLVDLRVIVALGEKALKGVAAAIGLPSPPSFEPNAAKEIRIPSRNLTLLQSYHPSPRAWNTRDRGSAEKLEAVVRRAVELAASGTQVGARFQTNCPLSVRTGADGPD